MRPVKRIDLFLNKVDLKDLFENIWTIPYNNELLINIESELDTIQGYWTLHHDLRFSQVLVNLGIIPNYPGFWYYYEESEILERQGIPPEEVNYWGNNFDKDMNLLPETIWKPISQLTSEHLKAIVNGGFVRRNKKYRQLMLKVLRSRGERL